MSNLQNPLILESKTLWIGDIEHWMDEAYVASLFAGTGAVVSVKIIRDKNTGLPSGYGFIEFASHQNAQDVLQTYHGKMIPGTNKSFRLNWGVFGGGAKPSGGEGERERGGRSNNATASAPQSQMQPQVQAQQLQAQQKGGAGGAPGPEFSIYVGELGSSVNDAVLAEFFSTKYRSVIGAKVIVDPVNKQSKGFGFVKFSNYDDSQSAIRDMQGSLLRGRAIKTSQAYVKNSSSDSAMSNLNSMLNPLAAIASSPFFMALGNLPGFGAQSQPGGQPMQSYPGFPNAMGGMPAFGGLGMPGMAQGYGMYQQGQMPGMQGYGYGAPMAGTGYDMNQGYQQQQYGAANNMMGGAYKGSFFDPTAAATDAQNMGSYQQQQQAGYPSHSQMGYQQQQYGTYDAKAQTTPPPQYATNQAYNPSTAYLQQQQQYINYSAQQQIQPTGYETATQGQQAQAGAENNAVTSNGQTGQTIDGQRTEQKQTEGDGQGEGGHSGEKIEIEDQNIEPIIKYNPLCIQNDFRYNFLNSDKIKMLI